MNGFQRPSFFYAWFLPHEDATAATRLGTCIDVDGRLFIASADESIEFPPYRSARIRPTAPPPSAPLLVPGLGFLAHSPTTAAAASAEPAGGGRCHGVAGGGLAFRSCRMVRIRATGGGRTV